MGIMGSISKKIEKAQNEMLYSHETDKKETFKKNVKGITASFLEGALDAALLIGLASACVDIACLCTGHRVQIEIVPKK